jgi:hypothetical protein
MDVPLFYVNPLPLNGRAPSESEPLRPISRLTIIMKHVYMPPSAIVRQMDIHRTSCAACAAPLASNDLHRSPKWL